MGYPDAREARRSSGPLPGDRRRGAAFACRCAGRRGAVDDAPASANLRHNAWLDAVSRFHSTGGFRTPSTAAAAAKAASLATTGASKGKCDSGSCTNWGSATILRALCAAGRVVVTCRSSVSCIIIALCYNQPHRMNTMRRRRWRPAGPGGVSGQILAAARGKKTPTASDPGSTGIRPLWPSRAPHI